MRQRLYILILAFSLSVLLGIPFVKHHHHGATVCMASEYCEHDHTQNDRHTSHHGDRSALCTERSEYVITRSADTDISVSGSFTELIGYGTVLQLPPTPVVTANEYFIKGTVTVPPSGETASIGLRAPPSVNC